jgi:hypothetical protein
MLTINKCYTGCNLLMPIAQSKRKLIAATALFLAIGALTGAIATGGAATVSYATTAQQGGGGGGGTDTGQQVRIVRQGTVTSEESPLPAAEGQRASILPLREDGSIYSGVLTFTASEPVNVVVLNLQDLNQTEQSILNATEDGEFGPLLTAALDNQTNIALTIIAPDYGGSPIPSASIAFAGNALWLHTAEDEPFVATYALSAQTAAPEMMNDISNVTAAVPAEEAADEEEAAADEEEAADGGNGNATDTDGGNATDTDGGDGDGEEADGEAM